jgi:hypothetical protein
MKAESIVNRIEKITSIEVVPARNVQIKKVTSIKDIKELQNRLPFLKKAIMTGGKILYENDASSFGPSIKAI